jgi:diacylglycerol kinase (ATP)
VKALVILNRKSRLGARDCDRACSVLSQLGVECELDPAASGIGCVVAAGGDGTVISAVPQAMQRGVPLGVVPLGTFNDLAHTLSIPLDLEEACALVARREPTRAIDVARVNGTYFVNEASIGVSARIARRQTTELKRRLGVLAILATSIEGLRWVRPFHVEVESEGVSETFRAIQLTVANSGRFGGIFRRADAAIDDGWLDLYSLDLREGLRMRRAKQFTVRTQRPHRIAADGEPAGLTPAAFEILPLALDVIVPPTPETKG